MKAGRELDALVADRVFGKRIMRWLHLPKDEAIDIDTGESPLPYSTDIAAAWKVVEHLLLQYSHYITIYYDGMSWIIELTHADTKERIVRSDVSAPYAICIAALKMVGYEVQK